MKSDLSVCIILAGNKRKNTIELIEWFMYYLKMMYRLYSMNGRMIMNVEGKYIKKNRNRKKPSCELYNAKILTDRQK
jgi:hypothetical protein